MAYIYLLDLHRFVDQRLVETKQLSDNIESNSSNIGFYEGKVDVLSDFKDFLTQELNPKLPRLIKKKHFGL